MDDREAAAHAQRNIAAAMAVWAGAAESGAIERTADATMLRVAAPFRAFNQVLLEASRTEADLARSMSEVDRFMGHGRRYRLRVYDDVVPLDDAPFEEAGLQRHGGLPCMAWDLAEARAGTAADADIRPVENAAMLAEHIAIIAAAFDWQVSDLARVLRPGLIGVSGWHAVTAYVDGAPAAAAQLVIDGDCGGLYYIATYAQFRRRGLGEAITRHAAAIAARAGCAVATLQASPMGEPVYERIGFRRVGYFRTYVPAGTA